MWRFDIQPHPATTSTLYAATVAPYDLPQLIPPDNLLDYKPQPQYQPPQSTTTPINMPPPNALPPNPQVCSSTYHCKAYDLPSMARIIEYLHFTTGDPSKSTWIKALQEGNYKSWPGLMRDNVSQYCVRSHDTGTQRPAINTSPSANPTASASNAPSANAGAQQSCQ